MRARTGFAAFVAVVGVAGALAATAGTGAQASTVSFPSEQGPHLIPGDLLVSTSYYVNDPNIVAGTTVLPPGSGSAGAVAVGREATTRTCCQQRHRGRPASASRPRCSFDEFSPSGFPGRDPGAGQRAEHQLLLQVRGRAQPVLRRQDVTFIDYVAARDTVDASNANTPGVIDPTNPVTGAYYRVASLSADGKWTFTETNAYSGNNGRAAVMAKVGGQYFYYTAGNAGNGGLTAAAGRRPRRGHADHHPVEPARVRAEPGPAHPGRPVQRQPSSTATGYRKVGKDDNFRGPTRDNDGLYQTRQRQRTASTPVTPCAPGGS